MNHPKFNSAMNQNPIQQPPTIGATRRLDSKELHITAFTMEYKSSVLRKFSLEIQVSDGSGVLKQYASKEETTKKGKLGWMVNASFPIASEILLKISKHHTFQPKEVILEVSLPFTDILKFFKENQQSDMAFLGPRGEKLSLCIELKSLQDILQSITLPSALLERLGPARQTVNALVSMGGRLGEINPIAKVVLGLSTEVYKQLEKQELCTQQVAKLFDEVQLFSPLLVQAQELEEFHSLQTVIGEILSLIQEVLEAISKYNNSSLGFIGQLWDQYKSEPDLDTQKFSDTFKRLYTAFNTSLQVDLAYNWKQEQIRSALTLLKPDIRKPTACCADDTCTDVLEALDTWAKTKVDRLFWLYGAAGMGKSTIAATFSNNLGQQRLLGGYHICSRDSTSHMSPTQLVQNLCHHLSLVYRPFGTQVAKAIVKQPILSTNIAELFRFLFLNPVERLKEDKLEPATTLVLVIDALDECGTAEERLFVIQNLELLVSCCTWIKVMVTSRPTVDIKHSIQKQQLQSWLLDPKKNDLNIEQFLQKKFSYFEDDVDILLDAIPGLVKQASGLFIWARTACEYLQSSLAVSTALETLLQNTSHDLYGLYHTILSLAIPLNEIEVYHIVMGAILLAAEPLSESALADLLYEQKKLERSTIKKVIMRLKALIYVGTDQRVYLLHPSLREYLSEIQGQPHEFYISQDQHYNLFEKAVHIMQKQLKFNICELKTSYETNDETANLKQRIDDKVSEVLQYSAKHWIHHMVNSGEWSLKQNSVLELFGSGNGWLYWIELLSLLGIVKKMEVQLTEAVKWVNAESPREQMEEIARFLSRFITPISQSVCHIYISALAFVPEKSWMAHHFWKDFLNKITVKNTQKQSWQEIQGHARIFNGHASLVTSVAFSSDNRYVISGSKDQSIIIWNVETGQQVGNRLQGHTSIVTSVGFSSSDEYVVSASDDKTVRIWNLEAGVPTGGTSVLQGHTGCVRTAVFSPNNKYVASGSDDRSIRIWNVKTSQLITSLESSTSVTSVVFSSDNKYVASASWNNNIRIWNVGAYQQVGDMLSNEQHPTPWHDLFRVWNVGTDQSMGQEDTSDQTIRWWDIKKGQYTGNELLLQWGKDSEYIVNAAFSSNNKYVIVVPTSNSIRMWDIEAGEEISIGIELEEEGTLFALSSDNRHIVSGSDSNSVKVLDVVAGPQVVQGHTNTVMSVAISSDNELVVSGSFDQTVRIWSLKTGQPVGNIFDGHTGSVTAVAFSHDDRYVVSGSDDSTIRIWDVKIDQKAKSVLQGHTKRVSSVAFSSDSKYIVSGSFDWTIKIWNVASGQEVNVLQGHRQFVTSVKFSSDNRFVVSGAFDGTLRIWDTKTGQQVDILDHHHDYTSTEYTIFPVTSVALSSDNKYVVSTLDQCITKWNVEIGQPAETLYYHTNTVRSVVLSHDDKYMVFGSDDGTVRIQDVETGSIENVLHGPTGWVTSVAVSSNRKYVVSGSHDNSIRIWNLETPQPISNTFHEPSPFPNDNTFEHLLPMPSELNSAFLADGWYYVGGKRYLWIPHLYRNAIISHQVRSIPSTADNPTLFVNLDHFVHGPNWMSVKTSY
ncbi:WD40 repeat-like protein [Pluteus cervinus]|uniref:WD40 repeat-like protein n=1 Tax=Pluteus cervinus TaxID=181527 RepID=A0ACD3B4C3_9AGAR|nr:WD40 repeat-like protein [Pluteus cervinus]